MFAKHLLNLHPFEGATNAIPSTLITTLTFDSRPWECSQVKQVNASKVIMAVNL